ncbi:MAG: hypothetical protein OEL88_09125 [Sterolibacteriaceae bacterium MAG5]|nr:hypothetical protein [Candidatus Nitricoxidireducens bremensis]
MTLAAFALQPGHGIAVLYPEIGEPYRSVFAKIIEGVEEQARGRVTSIAIGPGTNTQDLAADLRRQETRVVIALGRNGLKAASGLDRDMGVVAGGVLSVPEAEGRNIPVHSLAPDPALLFARLQALVPNVRRVLVVYNPGQNGWLIRMAREAAGARGLELVAYDAPDLRTALKNYQDIFAAIDPKRDALWLLQDSVAAEETTVLPLVLQETWSRNVALFSSNVAHVRRGALFALYPNNAEIGRHLGSAALAYLAAGSHATRGVTPLRAVLLAVNIRTAGHLGLNLPARQGIDLVFPEQ